MKTQLNGALFLLALSAFSTDAQEELPFMNVVQDMEFGELMALPGSCILNHSSSAITDGGGSLCPFPDARFGEAGEYVIVATVNTNVTINISIISDGGDGLSFVPSGIYEVFGELDTNIVAATDQTIFSGATGVISIALGGTLTASSTLASSAIYALEAVNGITFNEVP